MTGNTLKIVGARLAFTQALFTPMAYKNEAGKEKKYSAKFLLPKVDPQVSLIQTEIVRLANEDWKDKAALFLEQLKAENKLAVTNGDLKTYEGYPGNIVISAANKARPRYLDRAKNPVEEKDGILYAGCYVIVHISFWTQGNSWGKRINANLLGVQFLRAGDAFSGATVASDDDFDAIPEDGASVGQAPAGVSSLF